MEIGRVIANDIKITGIISSDENIYRGYSENLRMDIIVKRTSVENFKLIERDITGLTSNRKCTNVINYLGNVKTGNFRYLKYEDFDYRLEDLVEEWKKKIENEMYDDKINDIDIKEVIRGAMSGLMFSHEIGPHRDIRPENVVICEASKKFIGKIVDFSKSKQYKGNCSQVSNSGGFGLNAYTSQELLCGLPSDGKTDIFSMGCVFFYAYSGEVLFYEFGKDVEANIKNNKFKKNFSRLNESFALKPWEIKLLKQLIESMTKYKPTDRPTAENVLKHPFFWDNSKILKFFIMVRGNTTGLKLYKDKLNSNSIILDKNLLNENVWIGLADPKFPNSDSKITKKRFKMSSVTNILHAIRNLGAHCTDMKNINSGVHDFFESEGGIAMHFLKACPDLLHHVYTVMQNTDLRKSVLNEFYCDNYNFVDPN